MEGYSKEEKSGSEVGSCVKGSEVVIEMPFGLWTQVGPRKHVIMEVQIPMRSENLYGKRHAWACPTTLCGELCKEMTESIEMPFRLSRCGLGWAQGTIRIRWGSRSPTRRSNF